mmetsp:Transcript_118432/g.340055  ORF Transcript_118432/g.340055 Transcript_118432/m.340055 type:complete len:234 (-) Transcript_118432:53-754(-)
MRFASWCGKMRKRFSGRPPRPSGATTAIQKGSRCVSMCRPVSLPFGPSNTDGQPRPVRFVTRWKASCVRNEGITTCSRRSGQCFFSSISNPYRSGCGRAPGSSAKYCLTYACTDMLPSCTFLAHVSLRSSWRKVRMTASGQLAASSAGRHPASAQAPVKTTGSCAANSCTNLSGPISRKGTRSTGITVIRRGHSFKQIQAMTAPAPIPKGVKRRPRRGFEAPLSCRRSLSSRR